MFVFILDEQEPNITTSIVGGLVIFGNSDIVTWKVAASDNTGVVTLNSTDSPGDYFPIGDTNVTYWATDRNGLVSIITFTVRVVGKYTAVLYIGAVWGPPPPHVIQTILFLTCQQENEQAYIAHK